MRYILNVYFVQQQPAERYAGETKNMFQDMSEERKKRKRKKTVLRTIRISEDLDQLLQKATVEKQVSLNTLISTVLTQYVEWGRFADKFGIMSIQREILQSMIEALDDEKLDYIARTLGSKLPKEGMMFWFKEVNGSAFLSGISNIFRYGRIAELEEEFDESGNHILVAKHELGSKGSRFLATFIGEAAKSAMGGAPAEIEVTGSSLMIKLPRK
jgi:hypothetical protein